MTAKSEQRDAIEDELRRHGIKVEEYGNGGKHPWLMFRAPNGARMKIVYMLGSTSPRNVANARADVRRKMRTLGIQPLDEKKAKEKLRIEPVPIKTKPFEMPPLTEKSRPVGYVDTAIYDVIDRLPRNPVRIERPEPEAQPSMFPVASVAPPAASPAPAQEAKTMTETADMPGRKDRVVMTRLQVIKAAELLAQHSSERGDGRTYNNGYSDAIIAKMVRTDDNPIDPAHIGNLRREIYPSFRFIGPRDEDGNATPTRAQLFEMVKDMRARVEALEAGATAPESEYSNSAVKRLRELGAAV